MPECMHDYMYVCIYSCVCVCVYIYECMYVCMYRGCTCAFMCTYGYMCLVIVTAMQTYSCTPNPLTEDPDPIWIYVHYGPDTLTIQKLTHGMIQ